MLRPGSPLLLRRGVAALSVAALTAGSALAAPAPQNGDTFFRAYYLEHEVGDLESALELYRAAASDRSLSAEARARAERHANACAEEIAAGDLAALVPEDTIFYAELNEPGGQVGKLLDQLGLMQGDGATTAMGISPDLLDGALGLKGAAIAVTRVDPTGGMPGGVMILHPGDLKVMRGMIDTALPVQGQPVDPIAGHPTFQIEGMVFVTGTERLILASTERALIADVLRRVEDGGDDSLAAHPDLAQTMALRGDDLGFFCFNAEPVMPLAQTMLTAVAQQDPSAAMAMSMLDIESLQAVAGRLGVDDDGLSIDVSLQLAEGHRNVVFNIMRMPHVRPETYQMIPEGSAFFAAASLNSAVEGSAGVTDAKGNPIVTWMDLGREIFGNVRDIAIFSLPSLSEGPYGQPMPDMALAMSVNDAERSRAIWDLMLGVAKGASGSGDVTPRRQKVAGVRVDRYDVQGVSLYMYANDDRVVLSPSLGAIEAAVHASKGRSIAGDPAFADFVATTSSEHVSVVGVAVGRCIDMARPMIPQHEMREMGPILDLMADSTITVTTRHSDTNLSWSGKITGLPNVGPLVEQMVRAQMRGGMNTVRGGMNRRVGWRPMHGGPDQTVTASAVAVASDEPNWSQAEEAAAFEAEVASLRAKQEGLAATRKTFAMLQVKGKHAEAAELIPAIAELIGDDANELNSFAWQIISSEDGAHYAEALLPVSKRSNELTGNGSWYYLDTLAHVHFALGHKDKAIAIQQKAVEIAHDSGDSRVSEAVASLDRFKKGN